MKTYTLAKPVAGHPVGKHLTADELKALGGVERLLELQAIREAKADKPAAKRTSDA